MSAVGEKATRSPDVRNPRALPRGAVLLRDVIVPARRSDWEELVAADPDVLPSQSQAWVDSICTVSGWKDRSRLYVLQDGRRLLLPMVGKAGLSGPLAVEASLPADWGFGGLLADEGVSSEAVAVVLRDLALRRVLRQTVRPNPLHAEHWEGAEGVGGHMVAREAHAIDLRHGATALWDTFSATTRRLILRAEREVEVECDTTGRLIGALLQLLNQSYERRSRRWEPVSFADLRALRYDSVRRWMAASSQMQGRCCVWAANYAGERAAAAVVIYGRNAHCSRGAVNDDLAAQSSANYALQWSAVQHACARGCRWYHFGVSGESSDLTELRERFGAKPFLSREWRFERPDASHWDSTIRNAVRKSARLQPRSEAAS